MEERENGYQDREMKNEEKISFLEGQNRETEVRADQAERYCQTCERGILETTEEVWSECLYQMKLFRGLKKYCKSAI